MGESGQGPVARRAGVGGPGGVLAGERVSDWRSAVGEVGEECEKGNGPPSLGEDGPGRGLSAVVGDCEAQLLT